MLYYYSSTIVSSLFALLAFWSMHGCASPAPRTPVGLTYSASSTIISRTSYNASRNTSLPGTASSGLYIQGNASGPNAPPMFSQPDYTGESPEESSLKQGKVCLVGYCSGYTAATKTVDDDPAGLGGPLTMLPDSELKSACALWDPSCAGNKTAAGNYFFGTLKDDLDADVCFTRPREGCTSIESPARMSEFQAIQDWMRSPGCFTAKAGYNAMIGMEAPVQDSENCCGICGLTAGIVDVYYWPAPNASTACLQTIGTNVNPLTYGATIGESSDGYQYWSDDNSVLKSSLPTYWGCTTKTDDQLSFLSTAVITQTNSITFKQYLVNPWSPPSCVGSSSPPPKASGALAPRASIHARAHSLIIQNTTSQIGDLPASTVVFSGFTFTSPSIYANFQSISGEDECGGQTISSTMLSFTPGGLSTIENGGVFDTAATGITKPFDFRDLPCPPQSVMEANWYKPEPGEPYRPLIAMPDQIRKVNAFFSRCSNAFFTGFDPPKTLLPSTVMVPTTTAADTNGATSMAPMPSATQDPGARQTADSGGSKPVTGATPAMGDPKETTSPSQDPPQSAAALVPHTEDPSASKGSSAQPGSTPDGSNSNLSKHTLVNGDPQQATNPTPSGGSNGSGQDQDPSTPNDPQPSSNVISDPSNVSPDQMSRIENALALSAQGSQAVPITIQETGPGPNRVDPSSEATKISQGSPQAGNSQALPVNGSPQPNTALPSIDDVNAGSQPPAMTISVSNHVVAVDASGIHFDGSVVPSDQAHVVVSSVMAMNPSVGNVLNSYVANTPLTTQTPAADGQPAKVYQPTVINGEPAQRVSDGISIAGATIKLGAPPVTVAGSPVALGPSGVIVGASTVPLATAFPEEVVPADAASYGPTTVIGQLAQPVFSDGVSIAGAILTAGASPITISGTPLAVVSSGLVIGSNTIPLAAVFPSQITPDIQQYQPTTINGEQAQLQSDGGVSIAGTTLGPGAPAITLSGTPISVGSSNLIIGSNTVALTAAFTPQNTPNTALYQPTTINGQKAQLLPNGISIAAATLTPGAPAITVSGTPISVGSYGLVIGTASPIPLPSLFPEQIITTLANQAITILPTAAEIAGKTLTAGAVPLTISGVPIYIGSSGLVVGTNTVPLVPSAPSGTSIPSQLITTLAGQTITAAPTAVEVAGQTLTPGAPGVTLSGTLLSLNTAGGLVLGSQTVALQSGSVGLGGLIMEPFATGTSVGNGTGSGSGAKAFEGEGGALRGPPLLRGLGCVGIAVGVGMWL